MRLLEFESKRILESAGIAVPPSRLVAAPADISAALEAVGLPAALKAQVPTGGRMKAGGVVLASDAGQAASAASGLLGRTLLGHRVECLLIEKRIDHAREFYLAATYDARNRCPVLVASSKGGVDIEEVARTQPKELVQEPLTAARPFSPYRGIELATALGVSGKEVTAFSGVVTRLHRLFVEFDCTLAEINPLALTSSGRFVALDAHIEIDDDALYRHPELKQRFGIEPRESGARPPTAFEAAASEIDRRDHRGVAGRVVEFDGNLGLLIGGGGASLTVFDAILDHGGRPANYCEIGGNPSVAKIASLTRLILSKPGVKKIAVIMNVVNNTRVDLVARGVIKGVVVSGRDPGEAIAVFRIPGAWEDEGTNILRKYGVEWLGRSVSLDQAAKRAVDKAG